MDTIIARLLLRTDLNIHVILTGGYDCKILEQGWENEPRVHKKSGEWSIRETFTMLEHVDLVVGPETGVLNAACCLKVPKIVFLSHSTNENLTRDWVNTYALEPTKTACWPCHQLHYGWTYCKQVTEGAGNGAAQCSTDIGPEACWNAVTEVLRNFEVKAA
jgi:ADP-heptose:LPS heptosyltransferase